MVSIHTHESVEWGRIPRSKHITNQIESRGEKLETKSSHFFWKMTQQTRDGGNKKVQIIP